MATMCLCGILAWSWKWGTQFVIEPHIRFKGQVGEQATMFFLDPCGNAVEFKAFANPASLFAK
jgi:extradiol dioxygenase family protein